MNRRSVWNVVAGAITALLFATVSTSDGVHLWGEPQLGSPREREAAEREQLPVPAEALPPPDVVEQSTVEIPGWIEAILRVTMIAVAIVGALALASFGWRNRPRLRWRRRLAGRGDFDVLPDVATAVVDDAAAQRSVLLGGEPRNAIVRCWLQLEVTVAAAGLTRHTADTSAEFTERVLGHYSIDPAPIRQLADLYREARFSQHPIDEAARQSALDALDRLHRSLREASAENSLHDAPAVGAIT